MFGWFRRNYQRIYPKQRSNIFSNKRQFYYAYYTHVMKHENFDATLGLVVGMIIGSYPIWIKKGRDNYEIAGSALITSAVHGIIGCIVGELFGILGILFVSGLMLRRVTYEKIFLNEKKEDI